MIGVAPENASYCLRPFRLLVPIRDATGPSISCQLGMLTRFTAATLQDNSAAVISKAVDRLTTAIDGALS